MGSPTIQDSKLLAKLAHPVPIPKGSILRYVSYLARALSV